MAKQENQLAVARRNVYDLFSSQVILEKVKRCCVKHVTPERLTRIFLTAVMSNPDLMLCSQNSLIRCLMLSAQLGLEPDPTLGLCAYVPFAKNAQFIVMYRGKLDLAYRSGMVKSACAMPVHQNDIFEYEYGFNENLRHIPCENSNPGPLRGAYSIFKMQNGERVWRYCPEYEILKHMAMSKTKDRPDSPWKLWRPAMYTKTAIHVNSKLVKLSPEYQLTQYLDDIELQGKDQMDFSLPESFEDFQAPPIDLKNEPSIQDGAISTFQEPPIDPARYEKAIEEVKDLVAAALNKEKGMKAVAMNGAWPIFFKETMDRQEEADRDEGKVALAMSQDWDTVWATFESWFAANTSKAPPPEKQSTSEPETPKNDPVAVQEQAQTEDALIAEFLTLRKKGLKPWIIANRDRIKQFPYPVKQRLFTKIQDVYKGENYMEVLKEVGLINAGKQPEPKKQKEDPPANEPTQEKLEPATVQAERGKFPDYCPLDEDTFDHDFTPNQTYFDAKCPTCEETGGPGKENCNAWLSLDPKK